jgi:hypothetical protein
MFNLEQAMKVQRGVWVYVHFFFNLSATCGWAVNAMPWPLYPQERDRVPTVQEAQWSPGPVWTGTENSATTGIQVIAIHCTHYAVAGPLHVMT